jgi:preprotein translocase subunit SecE
VHESASGLCCCKADWFWKTWSVIRQPWNELKPMSNPPVETVSTGADKAKLAVAGLLVIGAVVAFYALGKQDQWVRVLALLGLLAAGVGIFFTSESGKQLIAYGQDSI